MAAKRIFEQIEKVQATIEIFARVEAKLRAIRSGMADDDPRRLRLSDIILTNQEIVEAAKRRLARAQDVVKTSGK